jgi:hypothetical protein
MSTRAGAEASDTLKYFSERLPATFVYSGSLLWLIRDAACQAILDGTEELTRKSLDCPQQPSETGKPGTRTTMH